MHRMLHERRALDGRAAEVVEAMHTRVERLRGLDPRFAAVKVSHHVERLLDSVASVCGRGT